MLLEADGESIAYTLKLKNVQQPTASVGYTFFIAPLI